MTEEFKQQYNQALSFLKKLEIDKALFVFYQLLAQHPCDYPLIRQIYQLELAKKSEQGINRIAHHIFSQADKSQEFHRIVLECFKQLNQRFGADYFKSLDYQQTVL